MGLRIKSVVSTNHRFFFGNRRHVINQFRYLENRFYIQCWLFQTCRKTKKMGRAQKNFSINQGSFGEFLTTGSKPLQHHKPISEFEKPISYKMWVISNLPQNQGPPKNFQIKDNYAKIYQYFASASQINSVVFYKPMFFFVFLRTGSKPLQRGQRFIQTTANRHKP